MAQVLKAEVRDRIVASALATIAQRGYAAASMAAIAQGARTATANVYRYFPDKAALFAAAVPRTLVDEHDALLETRLAGLVGDAPDRAGSGGALLAFWAEHRLAVAILLDRADGTPYADYPDAFVDRLLRSAEQRIDAPLTDAHRTVLRLVFDNTRRSIAHILATTGDAERIATLVEGFRSYQLPGLDGLTAWARSGR